MLSRVQEILARGSLPETPRHLYLHHMVMRSIAIAGQAIAIGISYWGLGLPLPLAPLTAILGLMVLLNLLTLLRLNSSWPVTEAELFLQLVIDVLALTALLYFTGGWTNPFSILFLLPLTICAVSLPRNYTLAMIVLVTACFGGVVLWYHPLFSLFMLHRVMLPLFDNEAVNASLHTIGLIICFALLAIFIPYYVVRITSTLRTLDRLLAEAREKQVRDDCVVAMGTMAAGCVHELSTPLSTMAIIVGELEQDYGQMPNISENLRVLKNQIACCKDTLSRVLVETGQARAGRGGGVAVDRFLEKVIDRFEMMRPAAVVYYRGEGTRPPPCIIGDETLRQAIINIINNAADASPDWIDVEASWDRNELRIEVRDRGGGVPSDSMEKVGRRFFTTKKRGSGFGVGLFLTNVTIGRFGGTVKLLNRPEGGACTQIALPLKDLIVREQENGPDRISPSHRAFESPAGG